jgi:ABC-type oligopeptide transport system substrate-binding subunit
MKNPRTWLVALLALALLLSAGALAACGSSSDSGSSSASAASDVTAAVAGDAQVSQYADAFKAAGISGDGPFTVFAASNDGITASGATMSAEAVQASVIDGTNFAKADLEKGTKSDSMLADNTIVTYTGTDGSLYVNDIKVIGEPITAGNGTVYVLDGAIQPKQ